MGRRRRRRKEEKGRGAHLMPFMAEEEGEEEEMGCGGDISDRTKSKPCCNDGYFDGLQFARNC